MSSNACSKKAVVVAGLGILGYLLCTVAITQAISATDGTDIVVLSPSAMEQVTGGWSGPICLDCVPEQLEYGTFCHQKVGYTCTPTNNCDGGTFYHKYLSKRCIGGTTAGKACRTMSNGVLRIDGDCECVGTFCNSNGINSGTAYTCDHNTTTYCF